MHFVWAHRASLRILSGYRFFGRRVVSVREMELFVIQSVTWSGLRLCVVFLLLTISAMAAVAGATKIGVGDESAIPGTAPRPPLVIDVWPGDVPGEAALSDNMKQKIAAEEPRNVPDRIFAVSRPSLTFYRAAKPTANGAAVMICPGGGYNVLARAKEGTEIAAWLNSLGVHAFVLDYRVPRRAPQFEIPPLQDAQRALRIIRSRAAEWDIDPARIGALGFSAGGHLCINLGTNSAVSAYDAVDEIDRVSCRPDFLIPIYAAYLGDPLNDQHLNPALKISKESPPMFLAVTQDDATRGLHAALLFAELTRAGVKAEVHVYLKGGHGYGMRPSHDPVCEWAARCSDWLKAMKLLDPAPSVSAAD